MGRAGDDLLPCLAGLREEVVDVVEPGLFQRAWLVLAHEADHGSELVEGLHRGAADERGGLCDHVVVARRRHLEAAGVQGDQRDPVDDIAHLPGDPGAFGGPDVLPGFRSWWARDRPELVG